MSYKWKNRSFCSFTLIQKERHARPRYWIYFTFNSLFVINCATTAIQIFLVVRVVSYWKDLFSFLHLNLQLIQFNLQFWIIQQSECSWLRQILSTALNRLNRWDVSHFMFSKSQPTINLPIFSTASPPPPGSDTSVIISFFSGCDGDVVRATVTQGNKLPWKLGSRQWMMKCLGSAD